jgi:hypothetical protein
LLDEHWSAMEADWQEHYRLDLAEAVYGEGGGAMSARRIVGLTLSLPPHSRTMRAVSDDPAAAAWTPEMMLAGLAVERIDAMHATLIRANGGKSKKPQEIVPRPKKKPAARRHLEAVPTLEALNRLDEQLAAIGGEG